MPERKPKKRVTIKGLLRDAQYWMMQAHHEAVGDGCDGTCSYHKLNRRIDRLIGKPKAHAAKRGGKGHGHA